MARSKSHFTIKLFLILLMMLAQFTIALSYAGTIFYVGQNIYQPDGSAGTPLTANNYGKVFIFRNNIAGLGGVAVKNQSYFPSDSGSPAYSFKDMSRDWGDISPKEGDVVKGIVEVINGENGYTGIDYIGASDSAISKKDLSRACVQLPDVSIQPIPSPEIKSKTAGLIALGWKGLKDFKDRLIESYVLLRAESADGKYSEIGSLKCEKGKNNYEWLDNKGLTIGKTYYYKLKLRFSWKANTPPFYETKGSSVVCGGIKL